MMAPALKRVGRSAADEQSASLLTKDRGNDIAPTVLRVAINDAVRKAPATRSQWLGVVLETIAASEIVLNGDTPPMSVPCVTPIGAIAMTDARCGMMGVRIAMSPGSPVLADQETADQNVDSKDAVPNDGEEDLRGVADRVRTARVGVDRSVLVRIAARGARVVRVTQKPSRGAIRATHTSVGGGKTHIVAGETGDSLVRTGSSSSDTGAIEVIVTTLGRVTDGDANGRPAVGPAIVITVGGIITGRITDTEIEVSRGTRCEAITSAIEDSHLINLDITDSHTTALPVMVSPIGEMPFAGSVGIRVSTAADRLLSTARAELALRDGIGWHGAASAGWRCVAPRGGLMPCLPRLTRIKMAS